MNVNPQMAQMGAMQPEQNMIQEGYQLDPEIQRLYSLEYARRDKAKKTVWVIGGTLTGILFLMFAVFALSDWLDGSIDTVEIWQVVPMMFIFGMMLLVTWALSILATMSNKRAIADLQTAYPDPQGIAWRNYKAIRGSNSPVGEEGMNTQDRVDAARQRIMNRNS